MIHLVFFLITRLNCKVNKHNLVFGFNSLHFDFCLLEPGVSINLHLDHLTEEACYGY